MTSAPNGRLPRRLVAIAVGVVLVSTTFVGGTSPRNGAAWAYWSAGSVSGGNGASAAGALPQGSTPTATSSGHQVTVDWVGTTLPVGAPAVGYQVTRYGGGTGLPVACAEPSTATRCVENGVPEGNWTYTVTPVLGTNWRGAESVESSVVIVDVTNPTNHVSLSNVTGNAVKIGDTVFYRGSADGSFALTDAATDQGGSGVASSSTAGLVGSATGWTHAASTVSTPLAGPYVSSTFSWTASTTTSPTVVVTAADGAGNTAATTLSFVDDSSGPTGGSVVVNGGAAYATSRSLSLTLDAGADPLATSGRLFRDTAPLDDGECGDFRDGVEATDPVDPVVSDTVDDHACYRYEYRVTDALGNETVFVSTSIKVDSTAPDPPTLAFSNLDHTYWSESSSTLYYNPTVDNGSFSVTASARAPSGIAGYAFQDPFGPEWTSTTKDPGLQSFSWSSVPAEPVMQSGVTATNMAGSTSEAATFTLTADGTPPSGVTVDYQGGTVTGSTVRVSFSPGADDGSGVANGLLQRQAAELANDQCQQYGDFEAVSNGTDATSPYDDPVTPGFCYVYRYVVADHVGNKSTATGDAVAVTAGASYFDTITHEPGLLSYWRLDEAGGSTLADSTETNNSGSVNRATFGVEGAIGGNTAMQFDGQGEYASVARQISTTFSIEFWFRSTQVTGAGIQWYQGTGLVDAEVGGVTDDFGIALLSGGRVVAGTGRPDVSIESGAGYNNDVWHQVVFTRDPSAPSAVLNLYLDGVLVSSANAGRQDLTVPGVITFGSLQTGDNGTFQGSLDEIALYTTALSPQTVAAHYAASK